jgi:hypothetical protein
MAPVNAIPRLDRYLLRHPVLPRRSSLFLLGDLLIPVPAGIASGDPPCGAVRHRVSQRELGATAFPSEKTIALYRCVWQRGNRKWEVMAMRHLTCTVRVGLAALVFALFAVNEASAGERNSRSRNNRNNRQSQSRTVSLKSGKIKRLGEGNESETVSLRERHEKAKSGSGSDAGETVRRASSAASVPPALKALLMRRILEKELQQPSNTTERSTMIILPPVNEDPFAEMGGQKPAPRNPKEKGSK